MIGIKKKNQKILASDLGKSRKKAGRQGSGKRIFFRVVFFFLLAVFIGSVFYVLFMKDFFLIRQIEISGNRRISSEEILSQIEEDQRGSWIDRIPKKNILLPWEFWERKKFMEKYKAIESFEIDRTFPDKMEVIIKEREPSMIMRGLENNCVFDEEGKIFDRISNFSYLGDDGIPVISQMSENPFSECPTDLDREWINFIAGFRKRSGSDLEVSVSRFFETPNLASGDLRAKADKGFTILLDENLDLEKELEMFQVVLDKKISRDELDNLDYIDLRTDNRVYYKLKKPSIQEGQVESDKDGESSREGN